MGLLFTYGDEASKSPYIWKSSYPIVMKPGVNIIECKLRISDSVCTPLCLHVKLTFRHVSEERFIQWSWNLVITLFSLSYWEDQILETELCQYVSLSICLSVCASPDKNICAFIWRSTSEIGITLGYYILFCIYSSCFTVNNFLMLLMSLILNLHLWQGMDVTDTLVSLGHAHHKRKSL